MNVLGSSSINKNFTRASEVVIPDIYNRRFKTGKESLDFLFGGSGFLPGQMITVAAGAGTGKTVFLLQVLQSLEEQGKKTAYVSGEENIEQISFACKRLNVTDVPLANLTYIEEIEEAVKEHRLDFLVLDSYPTIQTQKKGLKSTQKEEYIVGRLVRLAKEYEVCIALVLHMTKNNKFKGSTLLNHAVDTFLTIEKNPEDYGLRDFQIHKNRFGSVALVTFPFEASGYNFEAVETEESNKSSSKPKKKASKSDLVLGTLSTPKTMAEIAQETEVTGQYLSSILRQGILEGKISKEGKGTSATYVEVSEEKE
jgi:predicted ATP-dependent serine protease